MKIDKIVQDRILWLVIVLARLLVVLETKTENKEARLVFVAAAEDARCLAR